MPVKKIKRVNFMRLNPQRKQAAWRWLKQNRPADAELMKSDVVKTIVEEFDGEIILEIEVDET